MPGTELVDLVDESDRTIGKASLEDCLGRGLLHRAVAVLVLRSDGTVLLQRRSRRDRWHPGRWTISSTGHVKSGETYGRAARRELFEELGISSPVNPVGKFILPKIRSRGLTEWENVVLFEARTDEPARADPAELEDVRPVSRSELARMLAGRKLTSDAKILLREYLKHQQRPTASRRVLQESPQPPSRLKNRVHSCSFAN